MTQKNKSALIIEELIKKHKSAREFARTINEDISDVIRWRQGKLRVGARAAVSLAKVYKVKPSDLRPDLFPEELEFVFNT